MFFISSSLCFQIVSQSNWLPDSVTPAAGKEVEKLSFLGPFLALSVFAEDNVSPLGPIHDRRGEYHLMYFPLLTSTLVLSNVFFVKNIFLVHIVNYFMV